LPFVCSLACDKLPFGGKKSGPAGASSESAAADPAEAADEKLGQKLEEYLTGCLNNSARTDFRNSADQYEQTVAKKGPSEKEAPYLYKVDLKNVAECEQAIAKAKAMPPALSELEGAAAAYLATIKAGAPTLNEAQAYYDQKDYKDDKMAKGLSLHPQLVDLFKKFNTTSKAMSEAFSKQKGPLDARDLARLKTKGPEAAYLTKRSVMDADDFSKLLNVTSVKEFFAVPVADLQAKVDLLTKDLADLQKLVDTNGPELKGTSGVNRYASELTDFVKEAKEVTRRIRDKTQFTDSELERLGTGSGWMTEGSPDKLDRQRVSLIRSYNSIQL